MSLRVKILLWLMPVLFPMLLIIYLNYTAQRNAAEKQLINTSSIIIEHGARDLNDYILLKDTTYRLLVESLVKSSIDPNNVTIEQESEIGRQMKIHPGFSTILFTDKKGRVLFGKVGLSRDDIPFLPRNITGEIAFDKNEQKHLTDLYQKWKMSVAKYRNQIVDTSKLIDELSISGEKNSFRYRQAQQRLVALKEAIKQPPHTVFIGGKKLTDKAGLPFRSNTFIFAVPTETGKGKHTGFILGILDWTHIENKIYSLKSDLKTSGIPGADIVLFNMLSGEFLINSKYILANFIKEAVEQKTFENNMNSSVRYVESINAQMIFTAVVDTKILTLINDTSYLILKNDSHENNLKNILNKSDFYLIGYVPGADIFFHAEKLLWRSVFFTLLSIFLLTGIILLLSGRIVRPIAEMATMTKRISEGDLNYRITNTRNDEVGRLAFSFNQMSKDLLKKQTELEIKNKEIQTSENRYQALFDNAPFSIGTITGNGQIKDVNKTVFDIFGYTKEEAQKINMRELYQNPVDLEEFIQEIQKHGAVKGMDSNLKRKDGPLLVGRLTGVPVTINKDPLILVMLEDITRQKEAEREKEAVAVKLQRSQKMEAIGMMAGGVAHDLNNILSGIISYPELLLLDLPEGSPLQKPLETIQASGKRAADVVADLLTVARGAAAVREVCDLNKLVSDYLHSPEIRQLTITQPNVAFNADFADDLFNLNCSAIHIRKCLLNLVINAFEAIDKFGSITVSTTNQYVDTPLKGYDNVHRGEYVVLSVIDDGPGITPYDLERIFEPFYTKKVMGRSGTGLGLAVVWNTVQDHDGYIDVITGVKGTRFDLYFPASREMADIKKEEMLLTDLQGNSETILVIDDEPDQRRIACSLLSKLGYQSQAVASGEEAVAYLKEHTVDLLLLDMIMDPGINGRETYEQIVALHPNQKAVIASGFTETDDVKKTQDQGAGLFINKPYTLDRLGQAVKIELGKQM
ncbi:MAG: response regulator [Desulfobacula sp.]|uniref:response regulator n=1 Tax=Desulfobacula sp. TaxID=2593537 RepID=UPI0025C0CB0A|nr:response regulator [Desulfobacula sp.]MCD4720542.1 response regulator [Desulfobacula sp.]